MIKKLLFFILFLGCTHDFVENKVFLEPEDDSDFFQVLEPASRKAELFLNFKTIFIISFFKSRLSNPYLFNPK